MISMSLSITASAQSIKIEDLLAKMESAEQSISSLEFEFVQEILFVLTNETSSSAGKVSFAKPDNIRVEMYSPIEQSIVTNGKKVWIYTPKYNQVIVDSWQKWASNSFVPVSLIKFGKQWKDLRKKYEITLERSEDKAFVLLFIPKNKSEYKMRFWIEADSYIPVKIELLGINVTATTEMKSKAINPVIEKSRFSFKEPAGVEVLNLPQ